MANPQPDKAVTISFELLQAIARMDFSAHERKVIDCWLRFAYGYKKKEIKFSLSFIAKWIGEIHVSQVFRSLDRLRERNVFYVVGIPRPNQPQVIGLNKDYDTWLNLKDLEKLYTPQNGKEEGEFGMDMDEKGVDMKKTKKKESKYKLKEGYKVTEYNHYNYNWTTMQNLVNMFKEKKGFALSDKKWDKVYFGRYSKTAQKIMDYLDNDFNLAATALIEISAWCRRQRLEWTFETILKRLADWKLEYDKKGKTGSGFNGTKQ